MVEKKVGIILVNYNGAKDTVECLNSLYTVNYKNKKIYVVDNNSSEDDFRPMNIYSSNSLSASFFIFV